MAVSPFFTGKLYQRTSDDLHLAGLSARTHDGYLRAVRQLADYCRTAPDLISEDQLRRYFLHLKNERRFASGSLRVAYSGVKFFYTRVCPHDWQTLRSLKIQNVKHLPEVLTTRQVHRIIDACTTEHMAVYPSCGGGRRAVWLQQLSQQLLPCDHVHVIFTVPEALNRLWQFNRVLFANLLMQAAREWLSKLLADPQFLGAQPGILSALHTWGRNLTVHPHVHCLVTAGGLDSRGRFIRQSRSTLLPARVLMIVFRGKLRAFLKSAVADDALILPDGLTVAKTQSLLNRLGRQTWNVRIQERYPHGVSVAGYLARYITGGPISDHRLHSVTDSQIAFRYRDYRDGRDKLMRLSPEKFLHRWFEHVPPRGLRMIRRSGLYANCHAVLRRQIRAQHVSPPQNPQPPPVSLDLERCPECNAIIRTYELSRPQLPAHRNPTRREIVPQGQPP